ncbi:hypothetical protein VN97_g8216 [Penicillium thymicola]|uniref:Uncharacterized protein n=1 Tax=Penicillium thymicola TaxID=293382 RepID=A0AAI9TEV4_PENTH|nr:hypothetical protein VN97_g8216 [Penicillium thymicola]
MVLGDSTRTFNEKGDHFLLEKGNTPNATKSATRITRVELRSCLRLKTTMGKKIPVSSRIPPPSPHNARVEIAGHRQASLSAVVYSLYKRAKQKRICQVKPSFRR